MNCKKPQSININLNQPNPSIVKTDFKSSNNFNSIDFGTDVSPIHKNAFEFQSILQYQQMLNKAVDTQPVGQAQNTFISAIQELSKRSLRFLQQENIQECVKTLYIVCDWSNYKNKNLQSFFMQQPYNYEQYNCTFKNMFKCPLELMIIITNSLAQLLMKLKIITLADELLQKCLKHIQQSDKKLAGHLGVIFLNISSLKLSQHAYQSSCEFSRNAIMQIQQEIIEQQRMQLMDGYDYSAKIQELGEVLCKSFINLGFAQEKIGVSNESHMSYHQSLLNANKYLPKSQIEYYKKIYQQFMMRMSQNIQKNHSPQLDGVQQQKFRIKSLSKKKQLAQVYSQKRIVSQRENLFNNTSRKTSCLKQQQNIKISEELDMIDNENSKLKTRPITAINSPLSTSNVQSGNIFINHVPMIAINGQQYSLNNEQQVERSSVKVLLNKQDTSKNQLEIKQNFGFKKEYQSQILSQKQQIGNVQNQMIQYIEGILQNKGLYEQNQVEILMEDNEFPIQNVNSQMIVQLKMYLIPTKKFVFIQLNQQSTQIQHLFHISNIYDCVDKNNLLQVMQEVVNLIKISNANLFFSSLNFQVSSMSSKFSIQIKNQYESKLSYNSMLLTPRGSQQNLTNQKQPTWQVTQNNSNQNQQSNIFNSPTMSQIPSEQQNLQNQIKIQNQSKRGSSNQLYIPIQQLKQREANNSINLFVDQNGNFPSFQHEQMSKQKKSSESSPDQLLDELEPMIQNKEKFEPLIVQDESSQHSLNLQEINKELEQIQQEYKLSKLRQSGVEQNLKNYQSSSQKNK